jgi:hypothetical protein
VGVTRLAGDWRFRDTGLGENRLQARAAVGERDHCGVGGSADPSRGFAGSARPCRCRSLRQRQRPAAVPRCFDIADANLEMPFTAMTATNEGRINGGVIADAAVRDWTPASARNCWPVLRVWLRMVS